MSARRRPHRDAETGESPHRFAGREALVALALVLLHLFEPGLHALQHLSEEHPGPGAPSCSTSCSTSRSHDGSGAAAVRPGPRDGDDVVAPGDEAHSCELCSHLQRVHEFVPPDSGSPPSGVATSEDAHASPGSAVEVARTPSPPARGPPQLAG
ncbi:MAG: hypothetical protein R3F56_10565 [Planctomycetota bacterium]